MKSATVVGVLVAVLLSGCAGLLSPTPARHHPPLPDPEPMPNLVVEDVVAELEAHGFDCWWDRGGDIPASWHCGRGDQAENDWIDVGIPSDETGPIETLWVYRALGGEADPIDPGILDSTALADFAPIVALVVPDEHRPGEEELLVGIQSNFPIELGGGWILGFDRNIVSRTLHIRYAAP